MEARNQNPDRPATSSERQDHGHGGLIFMSSVALAFSTLGLLLSGFLAYQFFELRQEVREISNTLSQTALTSPNLASPTQLPVSQSQAPQTEGVAPVPSTTAQAPASNTGIQPGQFVQLGFKNTARIELLSVKRSQNSGVGEREFVNVQMRVHPLKETGGPMFWPRDTKARNPETGEIYAAVSSESATGNFFIPKARIGALVDAHVWLRVPENVNTIDIFITDTGVFKSVPISG